MFELAQLAHQVDRASRQRLVRFAGKDWRRGRKIVSAPPALLAVEPRTEFKTCGVRFCADMRGIFR